MTEIIFIDQHPHFFGELSVAIGYESDVVSEEDRVLSIAGESIDTLEDVRLAMLDRLPGEQVWIELEPSV